MKLAIPFLDEIDLSEDLWTRALLSESSLSAVAPASDDLAFIQYTGGTTGRSKGVMLTHRAVCTNLDQREEVLPTLVGGHRGERIICPMPIYEGYGQTEAGPILTFSPVHGTRKAGSVGIAVFDTDIEIVDLAAGTHVLPIGETGETRARGPQILEGYWNRPDETAVALRGGWLYTGDIGTLDADGILTIRDRKKDMAIVGGYNVYPREVDDVLFMHPAVVDAATVGVPDPYHGKRLCAFVVRQADARLMPDGLLAHCAANLAKCKVPSSVTMLDSLPKTTVGKTDKRALREQATHRAAQPAR